MNKIFPAFILSFILMGCGSMDSTNVFSPTGRPETVQSQCKPSCVISDLTAWGEDISPEDAKFFSDVIDGKLWFYIYRLNDGREGYLDKETFDSLSVGDLLPRCSVINAEGSCPVY